MGDRPLPRPALGAQTPRKKNAKRRTPSTGTARAVQLAALAKGRATAARNRRRKKRAMKKQG
jgi:hypothetical protein